jgi:hypothetical protein
MIDRVHGLTTIGPDAVQSRNSNPATQRSGEGPAAAVDQASLSLAAIAVLAGHSSQIGELKAAVDSGSYQPSPAAVAAKVVSGALAH